MKKRKRLKNSNILKAIIQLIATIVVGYLIFSNLKKEFDVLDINRIKFLISNIGLFSFVLIIILGSIGMSMLSFYDFFVLRAIRISQNLKLKKMFKFSFIVNSLNMVLGFGGIIGAGMRYYLYKPFSRDKSKLLVSIGMILISMLSGLSFLAILVIIGVFPGYDLYTERKILYYFLLLISLFLPIYLYFNLKKPKIKTDKFLAIKLTIVSFIEWLYAAVLILMILSIFNSSLVTGKKLRIIGIIIVASIAGLLSMVPSGLGVFDYLIIKGLGSLGFSLEISLSVIFLYRLSYYLVPFMLSLLLLILELIKLLKNKLKKERIKNVT